jgi:hypothetical protein
MDHGEPLMGGEKTGFTPLVITRARGQLASFLTLGPPAVATRKHDNHRLSRHAAALIRAPRADHTEAVDRQPSCPWREAGPCPVLSPATQFPALG